VRRREGGKRTAVDGVVLRTTLARTNRGLEETSRTEHLGFHRVGGFGEFVRIPHARLWKTELGRRGRLDRLGDVSNNLSLCPTRRSLRGGRERRWELDER
jgi:hypothetical protein